MVLAIAREVDTTVIAHIEGGVAGGHHSWEDLDELLLATYADLRSVDNLVVCVGGGIGTPDRAVDYLTGALGDHARRDRHARRRRAHRHRRDGHQGGDHLRRPSSSSSSTPPASPP